MSGIAPERRALEARIGHSFADPALLTGALTHPSAKHAGRSGRGGAGYERLEFLGDRVLGLIVAEMLLEAFPKENEGALSKRLVALVRKEALVEIARQIDLLPAIDQAAGAGGAFARQQETAIADGVEALIGAIFQDGGFGAARAFVRAWWTPMLKSAVAPPKDPKTTLQEWAQAQGLALPVYRVVKTDGPDHQPLFVIEAEIEGRPATEGAGRSKRIAEQAAATAMLEAIDKETDT